MKKINNVILVYKKSSYELKRYNSRYEQHVKLAHKRQKDTLNAVINFLKLKKIKHQIFYRAELNKILNADLIISVGGDGTFLEVSHYVLNSPILGINSDAQSSTGFFCHANKNNFKEIIENIEKEPKTKLTRMQLSLNDKKIKQLVVNDILIAHKNPAATTKYEAILNYNKNKIKLKNKDSGLLLSTGSGSSAFMYNEGGKKFDIDKDYFIAYARANRNSEFFYFEDAKIESSSYLGRIYIDGPHLNYSFKLNSILKITKGIKLNVIGDLNNKRKKIEE